MSKKERKTIARIGIDSAVLDGLKTLCKDHNVDLKGMFKRLLVYSNLTGRILSFPAAVTTEMYMDTITVMGYLHDWINNLSNNFEVVKNGKDIELIPEGGHTTPALIIGAGPSLKRKKHLELLAEKGFEGKIFAVDAALKDCLEAGVIPDYTVFLDASDMIFDFVNYNIIDEHQPAAIMNVCTHPKVVNRWKGDIYWYQTYLEEIFVPNVTSLIWDLTGKTAITPGGQCASLGWMLAHVKKYNPIVLIGVDLSYPADMELEGTRLFKYYYENKGNRDKEQTLKFFDKTYHHNFFNTDCKFDLTFDQYANIAKRQFKEMNEVGGRIINCTEGGTLEGEGIECMCFEDLLKEWGELNPHNHHHITHSSSPGKTEDGEGEKGRE